MVDEVRYEYLRPSEIVTRWKGRSVAYLPTGKLKM